MSRRILLIGAVGAAVLAGVTTASGAATTPTSLLLPQPAAFAVLGHSCGGIQEHAFADGFDPTSGYPTGDVFLTTSCSSGGRGSRPSTFSAWVTATWDFTGAVVTSAALATAPTVNPTFSAVDALGNQVYNARNQAYLSLAAGFVPTPRVTGISVAEGPASGGTTLTITGTGFTGATAVDFGTTAAASFGITSDTSITVVSPMSGPGTVDVSVTTGGGPSGPVTTDRFTFVAAPSVSGLSPNTGPVTGGTTVTITGANFTDATAVDFGGTPVGFTVDSDTTVTVVSPAGESTDAVPVTVTSPGGTSPDVGADRFTYSDALSVWPSSGPPRTAVTASGAGLSPGELVKVSYLTGLASPHPASVAVCKATVAADGTYSCTGKISRTKAGPLGVHAIVAKGMTSHTQATALFDLT